MNDLFKYEFNIIEIQSIIKGLKKIPYEESAVLINKIIQVHDEQVKELEKAAKETSKK